MQPFERAYERVSRRQELPLQLLKQAGSLGLTAAGYASAGGMLSKVLPFLSGGMTAERAIQGLTKINPKFGKFINESLKAGNSFEEIKEFIKDKVSVAEESKPQSLFRQLVGDIDFENLDEKTTKTLSNYSRLAQQLENQGKTIKDPVVKKLKKKIDRALEGLSPLETEAMSMAPEQLINPIMQPQQDQTMAQQPIDPIQQISPGQQRLMAILQKIQQSRGV